jgi:hypothetical protein
MLASSMDRMLTLTDSILVISLQDNEVLQQLLVSFSSVIVFVSEVRQLSFKWVDLLDLACVILVTST